MTLVVRAFPLRGSMSDLAAFASELKGARAKDASQFYRAYGVEYESWHLQETTNGPWVIAVTTVQDPDAAAPNYAAATEAFHVWFKSQVLALTGVDPNAKPLGPPTEEIFSWSAHPAAHPQSTRRAR